MPFIDIDLRHSSVCTDSPTGSDLFPYSSDPTQFIQNTGIERNGGISALYQQQTTLPTAGVSTMVSKNGTVIQVDASNNIRLNDTVIGNVGSLAVAQRGVLSGYLDGAWTADGTLMAINRIGTSIYVYEINPATGAILHSRSNVFVIPAGLIANICLVKYVDMHYSDNQEYIFQYAAPSLVTVAYILRESGTSVTAFVNANTNTAYFCWRFATGKYVTGKQGDRWLIGDLTTTLASIHGAQYYPTWGMIDRFPGTAYSRLIFSIVPLKVTTTLFSGYGEIGYTSAGVYSATATYYGVAVLAGTTVTTINPIQGPGYSECTFTTSATGTAIYDYYASTFAHNIAAYFVSTETETNTPINGYGKLTDLFNATSGVNNTNLVSWRVGFVNSQASFISAAPIGTTYDCIGVPITNLGEIDESYVPHIDDNGSTYSRILYRYNGSFFYVSVTNAAIPTLQRVGDNLYTVNCLSAINAIDIKKKRLVTGVNDYNGRLIWVWHGGGIISTYKAVGKVSNGFVNSIDPGDKLSTLGPVTGFTYPAMGSELVCPGIELPSFLDRGTDFKVDVYIGDLYLGSFANYNSTLTDPNLGVAATQGVVPPLNSLYVPDTRLPFGMGYSFQNRSMQTEVETILTGVGVTGSADIDFDYLCYELGNDLPALYQSFVLFGQTFLFDGNNIWFASFTGSLFSGRGSSPVCAATGVTLIASSPMLIYFLSSFDNSLYAFSGGRSLMKIKRLNDVDTIVNGVYNVRDDTLLLNGTNHFIWIRGGEPESQVAAMNQSFSGIVTYNAKLASQTGISLYDTQNGIVIANNTTDWIYSYQALAGSTVVPLTWQSGYHALKGNELSAATNWVIVLYSPAGPVSASVTLTSHTFDQDRYHKQAETIQVNPQDWDALGFVRVRSQPQAVKVLASSIQLDTTSYLTITGVSIEFADEGQAGISAARSV